ncbi:MAG: DUF4149 domain-containing protein [Pseudomonadota bacterium]
MDTFALIFTALLFGGMVLYSFGFAAFLFTALPAETAGPTIRKAFPHFYLFVIVAAGVAALARVTGDGFSAALLGAIALSTVPTREILMPAINRATDRGAKRAFAWLHGLSVAITLVHIGLAGWALARFV